MTAALETLMARRQTRALIAEDPRDVVFHRPTRVASGAGGYLTGVFSLPSQRVRIIALAGLVWDRSRTTPDEGRLPDVTHQLIGDIDLDVKKGDWFQFSENDLAGRYEVLHVSPKRHYVVTAFLKFLEDQVVE